MKLIFYGGAGTVTGANYMLESGDTRILIDCGLMQGSNFAERQNFEPFAYDPSSVAGVVITHAHLDHVGRVPKLWSDGFRGKVYSTPPTKGFAEVTLLDSEHILAREAEREHREPIYTVDSVNSVMELWETHEYHAPFTVGPFRLEFFDAGHILGSAIVAVEVEGRRIIFSGDIGNYPAPIIRPPERVDRADYCVMESAYGNRVHENFDRRREMLEDVIEDTVSSGGTLLIPAFALERTQEILYHLHQLFEAHRVPRVPVFIDSPLAIKLTAVYKKYERYFNVEASHHHLAPRGDDILNFPGLRLTLTTEQSKEINNVPPPKIIVGGSGMSQGGRILHHEMRYLPDPKNTILFVGYQAAGSLGRLISEGAREVTIFGESVPVRARVRAISAYSAHADQPKLFSWVSAMRLSLKKVFLVQGDPDEALVLAQKIRDELAVETLVPKGGDEFVL